MENKVRMTLPDVSKLVTGQVRTIFYISRASGSSADLIGCLSVSLVHTVKDA